MPTPASAATASIDTVAGSQLANSRSAAASTFSRFARGVGALGALFAEEGEEAGHGPSW